MVQVDIFWGYGFGASLAMAAGHKLSTLEKPFESKYFAQAIAFLALFWAPTGMLLLLRHPSWETMQAATDLYSMSEWLVLAFGVTNITQGILGFWVGQKLMKAGKVYLAQLNWLVGYFGMFFILLYGWDGLGYDRFLYDSGQYMNEQGTLWTPGVGTAAGVWPAILNFMTSSVAITLYTDGVWLLPPFVFLMHRWMNDSAAAHPALDAAATPGLVKLVASYCGGVFIVGLGSAAISALTVGLVGKLLGIGEVVLHSNGWYAPEQVGVHMLSYVIGLPLSLAVIWFALLRPGMPFYLILKPLCLGENLPAPRVSQRLVTV